MKNSIKADISDESKTKFTLDYYLDMAKRLEDAGAHIIAIKDMAGLLKPLAAETLITRLKETVDTPIHLHTHDKLAFPDSVKALMRGGLGQIESGFPKEIQSIILKNKKP